MLNILEYNSYLIVYFRIFFYFCIQTCYSMISRGEIRGCSYKARVIEINQIYDQHARSGLSNREILRRYIWPKYHIGERTFYNYVNALPDVMESMKTTQLSLF